MANYLLYQWCDDGNYSGDDCAHFEHFEHAESVEQAQSKADDRRGDRAAVVEVRDSHLTIVSRGEYDWRTKSWVWKDAHEVLV